MKTIIQVECCPNVWIRICQTSKSFASGLFCLALVIGSVHFTEYKVSGQTIYDQQQSSYDFDCFGGDIEDYWDWVGAPPVLTSSPPWITQYFDYVYDVYAINVETNYAFDGITSSRSATVQVITNYTAPSGTNYIGPDNTTINQTGVDDTYSFSPASLSVGSNGTNIYVHLISTIGNPNNLPSQVTIVSNPNWLVANAGNSLNNIRAPYPRYIFVQFQPNTPPINPLTGKPAPYATEPRSATIQINSHYYNVTQSGYIPPGQEAYKSDGCSCGNGAPMTGEPISIGSGNMYAEDTDYVSAGDNPLSLTRYYNSGSDPNTLAGTLGKNWRSTFDRYLRIGTNVTAERADGQEITFSASGTNWITDSDLSIQLLQQGSSWILTNADDSVETYSGTSATALLASIKARNGYVQTLQRDANNNLVSVTDSFGRVLQFSYQPGKTTVTAPNGLVIAYNISYDGLVGAPLGQLLSVSYSTTPQTGKTYLYENPNFPYALTGIIDENGNRTETWQYDGYGRAISSQGAGGADFTSLGYNADGSCYVTNALGSISLYKFSLVKGMQKVTEVDRLASANVFAATMTYTYDTNGYCSGFADWNTNKTTFTNDVRGLPLKVSEAVGKSQARTTTNVFLASFHLPSSNVMPRETVTFLYDTNGNMISRIETDRSTNTVPYSTAGHTRTWTNTYDALGHLLSATGPRTDVIATISYGYDNSNDLVSITDPLGHQTQLTNYTGSGLPLTMIDPNGVTTTFSYDVRDRLLSRTILAASGNATTLFGYDAVGQLTRITLPDGSFLNYTYDTSHRLNSISNMLGEQIEYQRDPAGNATNQTIRNAGLAITKTQNRVFDQLGRMLMQIGAASQTTTYGYDPDGNRISIADGLTNSTTHAFDPLNRLVSVTDPLGFTNAYGYDAQDNVVSVTDPRSLTTTYVYDGFNRVIQERSPDRGTTTYILDGAGNRTNETDARSIVTQRTFDKMNRVTAEAFPASPSENITYAYDSTSGGNFGVGRLTGFSDETGNTTLKYNERGDLISTTRTIGGTAYTTSYAYDLADRVTSITYPSGHTFVYVRDAMGRVARVNYGTSPNAPALFGSIAYYPFGPVKSATYGNGVNFSRTLDLDYRPNAISTSSGLAGHPAIQSLAYAYDAADDIKSIADQAEPPFSQTFGYDKMYRLTNATGVYGNLAYVYDGNGNRLRRIFNGALETNSYSTTSDYLLTSTKPGVTNNFNYNLHGDLQFHGIATRTNVTTFNFGYGNRNRLFTLNGSGSFAGYHYNALGERLIKTVSGATTHYHYDQDGHLMAESQANGVMIREYVWLDDMPIAQIEANGSIYYIHPDHLNRPQKITDSAENVVWDNEQQPFGEPLAFALAPVGYNASNQLQIAVTGPPNNSSVLQGITDLSSPSWIPLATNATSFLFNDPNSRLPARFYRAQTFAGTSSGGITNNLRFPGQYFDAESGLHYNMMRDYDPSAGRFVEADPFGLQGGLNLYSYTDGNSLNRIDADGEIWGYLALGILAYGLTPQFANSPGLYDPVMPVDDFAPYRNFAMAAGFPPTTRSIPLAKLCRAAFTRWKSTPQNDPPPVEQTAAPAQPSPEDIGTLFERKFQLDWESSSGDFSSGAIPMAKPSASSSRGRSRVPGDSE